MSEALLTMSQKEIDYLETIRQWMTRLHFTPTETTLGYFDAARKYLKQHGRPCAFYYPRFRSRIAFPSASS